MSAVNLEKLPEAALAYLQADYTQSHAYSKWILCDALGHPSKYPPGWKPRFTIGGCPCGKRKEGPDG